MRVRPLNPKVAKVPGEPIHAMNHDGVTASDELEHRLQPGTVCVASRCPANEGALDWHSVELPVGVLLDRADADLTNALAGHPSSFVKVSR
jgi:hypothetical protein